MLPIGTIVYLKEGTQKLMILNRGAIIETEGEKQIFDYSACLYPQGLISENIFYFNEENIDKVLFEGYKDPEEERFKEVLCDWKREHENEFIKGKITSALE
ncbi:DUF4176 domain-containing protein [Clostridium botulinum]|nr:DUF4176 domain-containing protein [Clostridium botulinum]